MEKYIDENYLAHYGVIGMKWGVRRRQKLESKLQKEKQAIMDDAKTITAKAPSGQTMGVTGRYSQKRNGMVYTTYHVVDDMGEVKLSYFNGSSGPKIIAAGKDYVNKNIDLSRHFRNVNQIDIEYDVYK